MTAGAAVFDGAVVALGVLAVVGRLVASGWSVGTGWKVGTFPGAPETIGAAVPVQPGKTRTAPRTIAHTGARQPTRIAHLLFPRRNPSYRTLDARGVKRKKTTDSTVHGSGSSRQALQRGSFASVQDLIATIEAFTAQWNAGASPFAWVRTADEIFAKAVRKHPATSDSGH